MTTAHRPTWKPSYGLSDSVNKGYVPTRSYSARDLPGYLKLKERQWGQGSIEELKEMDFKAELLKREAAARRKKNGDLEIVQQDASGKRTLEDAGIDYISEYEPKVHKKILQPSDLVEQEPYEDNPFPEDEDSEDFMREQENQKRVDSEEESSEDEDDEQLLREYERIKQQRQKQELHRREEQHRNSMQNRETELLKGNPLIDSTYSLSKRWYEDTVFRNQAKKMQEKKNFINDYVRSDFHRKFMNRYVMR